MDSQDESSTSEQFHEEDEQGWEDVHEETETVNIVSLFDDQIFSDVKQMLRYCKDNHNFDVWQVRRDLDLEFLDLVKLVNYIRTKVKEGNPKPDVFSKSLFDQEIYLKPVLDNDALLYSLDDAFDDEPDPSSPTTSLRSEISSLREQLAQLQSQFSAYRTDVQRSLLQNLDLNDTPASQPEPGPSSSTQLLTSRTTTQADADYFSSYSHLSIHSLMLRDTPRTSTYRDFIYDNKHLFANKTILDVGCGTGILSMFCARAGAKLVIAVDNSSIIDKAREIVFQNNLSDKITCLRGKIEEVTLPVPQVDIIVSEWMGYCLLYESMLDSVIYARDKYLKPSGLMVPSHATLKIAALVNSELRDEHITFWHDVYGFDMSSMLTNAYDEVLMQTVDKKEVVLVDRGEAAEDKTQSESQREQGVTFKHLNLHTATIPDLSFSAPFSLPWHPKFSNLDGFVIWFDVFFDTDRTSHTSTTSSQLSLDAKSSDPIPSQQASPTTKLHESTLPQPSKQHHPGPKSLSTSPFAARTHWYQGVLLLKDPEVIETPAVLNDQAVDSPARGMIEGEIKYTKAGDGERSVDIEVQWDVKGIETEKTKKQVWKLE